MHYKLKLCHQLLGLLLQQRLPGGVGWLETPMHAAVAAISSIMMVILFGWS